MILALTLRTILVLLNVLAVAAIVGVVGYKILSTRRTPQEKDAQNLTPFYEDDVLEGRHLERVLRWALILSTIIAVVLPLYWLLEPSRQNAEAKGFEDRAVERGEILYSNAQMPNFENTKSLQCANCHGTDAGGGGAQFVITPEAQGDTKAPPISVTWRAPALDTLFSRFGECSLDEVQTHRNGCSKVQDQVAQIIVYGRPGTPMPAWGIAGGGPKNNQAISDLVAYLKSIQLTPAKAKAQVTKQVTELETQAKKAVETAQGNLAKAQSDLTQAKTAKQKIVARTQIDAAQKAIEASRAFAAEIAAASEGRLLFETQCARCHTKGWSYNDPTNGLVPPPSPQGSGAFGPSLRGGTVVEQFPGDPIDDPKTPGFQKQYEWVAVGVDPNKGYGVRGISSGRMPHFGLILSKDQIEAIIRYERNL